MAKGMGRGQGILKREAHHGPARGRCRKLWEVKAAFGTSDLEKMRDNCDSHSKNRPLPHGFHPQISYAAFFFFLL